MAAHNDLGHWGEDKAAELLERQGLEIVARNWKFGHRDLDIVALDEGILVVVEVKTRRNDEFLPPELAVSRQKIKSITVAANAFVKQNMIDNEVRFDIVTVVGDGGDDCEVKHIPDAFLPI